MPARSELRATAALVRRALAGQLRRDLGRDGRLWTARYPALAGRLRTRGIGVTQGAALYDLHQALRRALGSLDDGMRVRGVASARDLKRTRLMRRRQLPRT